MVHARKVGNRVLTFIVSGKLWRNSLIMQDKETGTLWSHITGEALSGPLAGKKLRMLPVVQTTWKRWRKEHPRTKVLKKPREIKSSRYESYFRDRNRAGIFRANWLRGKMAAKALVYGVTIGPHALAVPEKKLPRGRFVAAELGGSRIVVARGADGGVRAYRAAAAGRTLTFRRVKGAVRDEETGSTWDLDEGRAVSGPLAGQRLPELVVQPAFWFAWSGFYPNTRVLD